LRRAALSRCLTATFPRLPGNEQKLADELFSSALDYALARGRWQLSKREERANMEGARTLAHVVHQTISGMLKV
jgi:hypothetical protein